MVHERLGYKIGTGEIKVGIIGLGYVGLPLARAFSSAGIQVLGFDVDPFKVSQLENGVSYIGHISNESICKMGANRFEATYDFARLKEPDVIIICVPTPLTDTREPDLSYVVNSAKEISKRLRYGQLVILESTTYPGTTRNVVLPQLALSFLKPSRDFLLAYSPEREDPGNKDFSTTTIPKVVGGLDTESLCVATMLYEKIVPYVIRTSSLEVAEACKILENTYRAVNIALVNELKMLYDRMGINIWEVIEAAKTKPFGFQAFYPGPGLGGHCIPIDPFYLTWIARKHGLSTRFIELAGEINTMMPSYVVDRISDALNDDCKSIRGSRIGVLGMAYKKDVDDLRESPGFELIDILCRKGAVVQYNDPHIPQLPSTRRHPHLTMKSAPLTHEFINAQDCIVVVTNHSDYNWEWIANHNVLIIDTRNAFRDVCFPKARIVRA